jgi:PAS domain-containing protein
MTGSSTTTGVGTLRSLGTPLPVRAVLEVAIAVAGALALRHGRSGLHGGVSPDSILIGPDGHVTLLDAPRGDPGRRRYSAPEQSGRLSRDVDERADLYALGAVLYELATGRSPVPARVHAQLTQAPPPVVGLPAGLAGVVHRLLSALPEGRYRTARGVLADLRRCEDDLAALGEVDAFPTGVADLPARPTFTGRLYGRAKQLGQLHAARERVLTTGGTELVWLYGDRGLGKSALLATFGDDIVRSGGIVARTAFRGTDTAPYAGLARLLADLAGHLALVDEEGWRSRLTEELGGTAPVLATLAPELAPFVGAERGYPAPQGKPAGVLLRLGLRRLLSTVVGAAGPLTLVLDDVHGADPATIDVLRYVLTDPETTGLLVAGAYRQRDLPRPVTDLVHEHGPWHTTGPVAVRPLPDSVLAELLADTLHRDPAETAGLARAVAERTGSRPLAVAEFLRALHEKRVLRLDEIQGWRWDPAAVTAAPAVRELSTAVEGRLAALPARLLGLLQIAAALGGPVTVTTLTRITGLTRDSVQDLVRTAIRAGLLATRAGSGHYRWTHEEVRRAVRDTLGSAARRDLDAEVGRNLLRHNGFRDAELIVRLSAEAPEEAERASLAERALWASRRAYRLGALDVADARMRTAVQLLPPGPGPLGYEVHLWAARTAWDNGDAVRADALLDTADRYACDVPSRARVLALRARWHGSRTATIQALQLLDVTVTRRVPRAELGAPATDPRILLAFDLIADALDPAGPVDDASARLAATGVRLALESGPAPAASVAYAMHAVVLAERAGLRESPTAVAAARTALALCAGNPVFAVRVAPIVGRVRGLWYEDDALAHLDEGYRLGTEAGEPARALAIRVEAIAHRFVGGAPLNALADEVDEVRALADRYRLPDPTGPVAGAIARLRGHQAPLRDSVPDRVAAHLLGAPSTVDSPTRGVLGAVAAILHGLETGADGHAGDLLSKVDSWALRGAGTFAAYAALVAADRAGRDGDAERAGDRYARAVDLAREHGNVVVEGLAAELGGRYALGRGQAGPAVAYLRRARDCYQRWRAPALVAHVDRTLAAVPSRPDRTFDQLDLLAMVRAFQAIAGELSPDRLVVTLLTLLVEHTHAERGALLLPSGLRLTVAATAQTARGRVSVTAEPDERLPWSVVEYVHRTRRPVGGAPDELPAELAEDPYLAEDPPRALLGTPILRDGRLMAVLYLEHRHLSGWFGAEHLDLLDVLGAQAAIALDNAHTHAELVQANQILDATFDRLPIGLILLGPDLTVRRASARAVEVTGLPIEPGTPLVDLFDVLTPTDSDGLPYRLEPGFARSGGADRRPIYREVWIVSPAGERLRVHTTAQPLRDNAGTLIGVTLWVSPLPPDAG